MSLHIQENTNNKVDDQDGTVNTSEEIFPPLIVKQLSPPILSLLSKYSHVFSKNKYDVGKIRIEPTRINLTSDLPVSQRAYRTLATEEVEINKQPPKNFKQLQCFLGSVNVYNKFIDSYAKIREPLNKLLKKDKQWHWTAECQEAFELLKNKLVTKPVLQLYDPKLPLHVFCDASQVAIRAILKQPDSSGNLHPVSYHSRTLRSYEKNYCITELECLAIVDALDKFYYYLHGKKFIIHTDHAALVWLKNVKKFRGRLFRWSLKLSMFDYEVKYLKGTANVEADMLSRHPTAQYIQHSVHLLELDEIKTHQNLDNLDNSKYKKINDVLVLKKKNLFKIVVPFSLRRKVLRNAHEQFGHPGTQKMINLITPQYYWPHINQDISVFVKHCDVCQLNKKKRQKRFGLLQTVPPTDRPFEYLSISWRI
ncbi:Transposon Tf2-9 polyprotein [Araneus ventricosus]|uniref:RNA-directed DNA polymerase n=1 Tax=Araneus ventricosus TaxID=182803 RepID=A0A4Y2DYS2_ARAVE|nr:Transposon Tf2-9 polyprotein [Araneus ventricosus]